MSILKKTLIVTMLGSACVVPLAVSGSVMESRHSPLLATGADYAEFLPKLDPIEILEPGDVVGLFEGAVTKTTRGASHVMVVSTKPALVGNAADGETQREGAVSVAFIGQVPVKVRGPVSPGEFIVPSDRDDGTAVAVSADAITNAQLAQVIGTAWQSASGSDMSLVNTAIGIGQGAPATQRLIVLEHQLTTLAALTEALATQLTAQAPSGPQGSASGGSQSADELTLALQGISQLLQAGRNQSEGGKEGADDDADAADVIGGIATLIQQLSDDDDD